MCVKKSHLDENKRTVWRKASTAALPNVKLPWMNFFLKKINISEDYTIQTSL